MTWRRSSILIFDEFFYFSYIPSRDKIPTTIWVICENIEYNLHLIDNSSLFCFPCSPLFSIDRTEISPLQSKFLIIFYILYKFEKCTTPLRRITRKTYIFSCFLEIFRKCPLIPDFYIILDEISDIGIARYKPD